MANDDRLTAVLAAFADAWNQGPPPDLQAFVLRVSEDQRSAAANALAQIDLERRWQAAHNDAGLDDESGLPDRPRAEDYLTVIGEWLGIPSDSEATLDVRTIAERHMAGIVKTELRVRAWFNRPVEMDELRQRFPSRFTEFQQVCAELLADVEIDVNKDQDKNTCPHSWPGGEEVRQNETERQRATTHDDLSVTVDRVPVPDEPELVDQSLHSLSQSFQSIHSGVHVGDFVLSEKLGEGGCGVVYRASRIGGTGAQGLAYAVKLIRPDRLGERKSVERFRQEIAALQGFDHPNVVRAVESGDWQRLPWLAMEFVVGTPVNMLVLRQGALPIAASCEIVRQAAVGMQYVLENGRTHRDLKPSNLIVTADGTVKIVDLGMARLLESDDSAERLTSIGEAIGTPDYMAPEQWTSARSVDIRADIYSLGCTLFCLLTGRPPFGIATHQSTLEKMAAHQSEQAPTVTEYRRDVHGKLDAVLQRCLRKQPHERFATPAELAEALAEFSAEADLRSLGTCTEAGPVPDFQLGDTARDRLVLLHVPEVNGDELEETVVRPSDHPTANDGVVVPNAITGPGVRYDAAKQMPVALEFEETLVENQALLERASPEATIKPGQLRQPHGLDGADLNADSNRVRSAATGQMTGATSGPSRTFHSTMGTVVRMREVAFGTPTTGRAAEYEIGALLGQGGMGAVYRARQGSVDRSVALKMVQSRREITDDDREKFLAEAVITGALEHPNIVPIYDLGTNSAGELFYSMKEVRGKPWRKTIDVAPLEENLEVLLRVTDAIAFAHSRGVVHRDLKPDNVMIGEFGEVLVMDWGLALPTAEFGKPGIPTTTGPAGTPSYMAPEMAKGLLTKIGPASDVYLLGAQLFRILTGKAPHRAPGALACLIAAGKNEITPFDDVPVDAELMTIALKAMATEPADRYPNAPTFAGAIRNYRSHAESRKLTDAALNYCSEAEAAGEYRRFEKALIGLEEAIGLWDGNQRALSSLSRVALAYAQLAFARGDLELAERQLVQFCGVDARSDVRLAPANVSLAHPQRVDESVELLGKIRLAVAERNSRLRRLRQVKRIATGLAAVVFITISVAALWIDAARRDEQVAKIEALRRFQQAHTAIDRISGISDALQNLPRLQKVRTNLLEMVAGYYHELTELPTHDSQLKLELARSLVRLGQVYSLLAEYQQAIDARQQALKLMVELADGPDLSPELREIEFSASIGLARDQMAIGADQAALQILQTLAGSNAADDPSVKFPHGADSLNRTGIVNRFVAKIVKAPSRPLEELAEVALQRGLIASRRGEFGAALLEFLFAIETHRQVWRSAPDHAYRQWEARAWGLAGQTYETLGEFEPAFQAFETSIDQWLELGIKQPDEPLFLEGLATGHIDLANARRSAGLDPIAAYRGAIQAYDDLTQARPEIPHYRFNRATAQINLAWSLNRNGLTEEAQALAVSAITEFGNLTAEYPEDQRYLQGEAYGRLIIAEVLRDRGEFDLATQMLDESHQMFGDLFEASKQPLYQERIRETLTLSGQTLAIAGDLESGTQILEQVVEEFTALVPSQESSSGSPTLLPREQDVMGWACFELAWLLHRSGDSERASAMSRQAIASRETLQGNPRWVANAAWTLLQVPDLAQRDATRATSIVQQELRVGLESPLLRRTLLLGQIRSGQLDEAARLLGVLRGEAAAVELEPAPAAELQFLEALLLAARTDAEAGLKFFQRGDEIMDSVAPGNPRLMLLRREAAESLGVAEADGARSGKSN